MNLKTSQYVWKFQKIKKYYMNEKKSKKNYI